MTYFNRGYFNAGFFSPGYFGPTGAAIASQALAGAEYYGTGGQRSYYDLDAAFRREVARSNENLVEAISMILPIILD